MAKPKMIKVCLTNRGADTETPWAHDLGPASPPGSRRVRLVNVPFMHAKPTWGDVIVVAHAGKDALPTWDRDGVPWSKIGTRIAEDGGRWAMIVDYTPHPDAKDTFAALARACAEHDIVCEGAWAPRDGEPGRAYLAARNDLTDVDVMTRLRAAALPCELVQIHPAPPKPKPNQKPRPTPRKKPAAKRAKKRRATRSRA